MKTHLLKTLALLVGGSTAGFAVSQSSVAMHTMKSGFVELVGMVDKGPTSQLGVYEERLKASLKSFGQAKATVDQQLATVEKKSEAREQEMLQVDMLWLRGTTTPEMMRALNTSRASVYRKLELVHAALKASFPELDVSGCFQQQ
ncbi:MAG: hypothetical protein ACKOBW_17410 [Planctomycetota bacterium]